MRQTFIAHLWQADFLAAAARKGLAKNDLAYISLCCSTASLLCAHAWHAVAGVWALNEKGLIPDTDGLPIDTDGFAERATAALASLASDPASAIRQTAELIQGPKRG